MNIFFGEAISHSQEKDKKEDDDKEKAEKDKEKRFSVLDKWLNGKDKEALDEFCKK